jgi:hypothetical protein
MNHSRGSFLIVCLVMMTMIVVLSFAVLHSITAEIDVSTGNQRYLLSQEAAKAGTDHAIEQILIDYAQSSITLPKYGGSSVTLPAITYLDGPYRAPFAAITYPHSLANRVDENDPAFNDADVRAEDYVLRPWARWSDDVYNSWNAGLMEYDGKGRYYEPGYYNVTRSPVSSVTPLAATSFVNLAAAVPERSQGIFYDEQFRRITPSGNPAADRAAARYRLRYSVGVEDLSGHLLINPMPDMQMRSDAGTPVDYRTPATNYPWMTTATNAIAAIAGAAGGSTFGAQFEPVFQGRGYHTNIDFDQTATGLSGWPKTFPLMYRNHYNAFTAGSNSGSWDSYLEGGGAGNMTTNLYYSGWNGGTSNTCVKGRATGGEVIPTWVYSSGAQMYYTDGTINHALMGPQLSFQNVAYSAHGETANSGGENGGTWRSWDSFIPTPYGRGQTAATYTPGQRKWYQGQISTPIHVNVMTAPPSLINEMLIAYLPPIEKTVQYTTITWSIYAGVAPGGGSLYNSSPPQNIDGSNPRNEGAIYGRDLLVNSTYPGAFQAAAPAGPWNPPTRVDATVPLTAANQGAFNPPFATGIGQVVSPDYYAVDLRNHLTCYPGPFMNGDSSVTGQGSDDLGAQMDEAGLVPGFDFYTLSPFASLPGGNPYEYASWLISNPTPATVAPLATSWATVAPPANWGSNGNDFVQKSPPPVAQLHNLSYFLDLLAAMGTAVGVLRAEYTQYSLGPASANIAPPSQFFAIGAAPQGTITQPLTDPDPSKFITLHDLDRVFLAEMGESISAPGTGAPLTLYNNHTLKAYRFHGNSVLNGVITPDYIPKNNIYSLLQYPIQGQTWQLANADNSVTKFQRAHVMELMLNDFRMSFLGSSADYSDGIDPTTGLPNPALQFMPLDFDGDGTVYCSCYPNHDIDGLPCASTGTKPPCYFTVTGNLFMGKSHYYRIFSRGEIWDNFLNCKVDNATLDSVIAVDPEGNNPLQTQMLYQRWWGSHYYANISHVQR